MLLSHRHYQSKRFDAYLGEHVLLHTGFRMMLKERRGLTLDDGLFGSPMRSVERDRSVLIVQLEGDLRLRTAGAGDHEVREGTLIGTTRNRGLGIRQEDRQRSLLIEWEPGLLGSRLLDTSGALKLPKRSHATLSALALRLGQRGIDVEEASGIAAELLALLRAEGLPFDPLAPDDLRETVPPAYVTLTQTMDDLLSSLSEGPDQSDLEQKLGWSRHWIRKVLLNFQRTYALQSTGGWRSMYHWWRLPIGTGLMSVPGARTEEVASLLGYASPQAFCNAFANAGLPSPGAIPEHLRELS